MDRRSFLGRLGIGGAAAVTTQLWLPPVSTAVAQPERRVFVPPRGGWGLPSCEEVANWRVGELNAMATSDGYPATGGGYLVPANFADELMRILQEDAALNKIVPSIYATPRNFTLTGVWG